MATESPMRLVEGGGARKWPFSQDPSILGSPLKNMAAEELGMLMKGNRLHKENTNSIPNRSGSAPPSMEGSFAAIGNFLAQENFSMGSSFESLINATENCESEEQLRSDPAYLAYYFSNVNLNPRLPPPLTSRESRRLVCHIGGFGNNWRSASLDDSGNKFLKLSRVSLTTHKEEPEDDRSPREGSETCSDSSLLQSGGNTNSLVGRHKSVVDLIQEDFPRTPSPVYTQSRSSSHSAEESVDHYAQTLSTKVSSINISKVQESSSASSDICVGTYANEVNAMRLVFDNDAATASFPSSPCLDETPTQEKVQSSTADKVLEGEPSTRRSLQSGIAGMDSRMRTKQEEQQSRGRNISQLHPSIQPGIPLQARVNPQGMQPMLSPAVNPPLYAAAAAYMTAGTAFYPNFQPSGIYSPHYSISTYSPGSTFLPPYNAGYPSHNAIPVPFGVSSGPTYDGQAAGVSAGEHIPHASDLHYLSKVYSQQGLMLQPSFVDPLHLQYFQHSFGDTYGSTVQQNHMASSGSSMNHGDFFVRSKESVISAYLGCQKVQPLENGNLSIPSPEKVGITMGSYYGGPSSMGLMTQFPSSPLMSPGLPSSPVGGINHLGRQSDMRIPQGSTRNVVLYPGGQSQRGINSLDDPKRHYFLEELKSNNAQKFELSDIVGRVVEFSVDQHGSRFIQQKLELCNIEEKTSVFREVLPHALRLMTDVFGNYVIQKFFEHGSPEQQKELADKLAGHILQLSLQMYGCRVIQKALEVIEHNQKIHLVQELDGHVMRCVHDQNGNHVIQKCIERVPANNIEFIIYAFRDQVATLSTHPYGCRVIQRVLEHCSDDVQSQCIVDEILESAYLLAQDQYGNYVIQHVLERGKPHERSQIMSKLMGKIVQMSQHKYASNVVEKCLSYGDAAERELLIEEIIGPSEENDHLLTMMKDQFANYVVQKILEISNNSQREVLLNCIRFHLHALKKYTYGKHIVARFEQLCGEEGVRTLE